MGAGLLLPIYIARKIDATTQMVPKVMSNDIQDQIDNQAADLTFSPIVGSPFKWFYVIFVIWVAGQVGCKVMMSLSDAFCANVALLTNKTYGSIRFYGAIGRTIASFTVLLIIDMQPFLVPSLVSMILLTTLNLLIIALWPNNQPFDLSQGSKLDNDKLSSIEVKFSSKNSGKNFWFFKDKTATNCKNDICTLNKRPVEVTKAKLSLKFDTREEDMFRNIRRCSLAPLGDSFMIKQFELDEKSVRHFNYVTKIEPIGETSQATDDSYLPKIEYPIDGVTRRDSGNLTFEWPPRTEDRDSSDDQPDNHISFMLYLRILIMIAKTNKKVVRFMLLFLLNGIVASATWTYLFRYLDSIDPTTSAKLSAYVMISRYLSETLFYSIAASKFFRSINHSNSLNMIMIVYVVRYLLYSLLNSVIPLEFVVAIEALRALNTGWFNCVMNESAIEFASSDTEKCVRKLADLGVIENNEQVIGKISSGFKATIVVISNCCFDGLGIALGALISGLIVDNFGYQTLWLSAAAMCLAVSCVNYITYTDETISQ